MQPPRDLACCCPGRRSLYIRVGAQQAALTALTAPPPPAAANRGTSTRGRSAPGSTAPRCSCPGSSRRWGSRCTISRVGGWLLCSLCVERVCIVYCVCVYVLCVWQLPFSCTHAITPPLMPPCTEGVAVFLAAHKSSSIGLSLALAIALHNIPEGVAVALPVYFATGSRLKGFNVAAVSGLAEPLAVVVLAVLLPSGQLPHAWVEMVRGRRGCETHGWPVGWCPQCRSLIRLGRVCTLSPPPPYPLPLTPQTPPPQMLAAVGGIMAFIAFHELLPLSIEHAGKSRAAAAMFVGMALMSFNLYFVHTFFPLD
jgi:hypothetical protein